MDHLINELRQALRRDGELYPPYWWNKLGVSPEQFTGAICAVHKECVLECYQGRLRPYKPQKWVIEHCDSRYNRGRYVQLEKMNRYLQCAPKKDQHISTFAHDQKWIKSIRYDPVKRRHSVGGCRGTTVYAPVIWIDIDREDVNESYDYIVEWMDAFAYINRHSTVYFSGNRGFHIAVPGWLFGSPIDQQDTICGRGRLIYNLAHRIGGDLRWKSGIDDPHFQPRDTIRAWAAMRGVKYDKLEDVYKLMENIDPGLYSVNSLIRQPGSIHEKSGDTKRPIYGVEPLYQLPAPNRPPLLLHMLYECYPEKQNPNPRGKRVNLGKEPATIIQILGNYFPDLDPARANSSGWVTGLYNPLYQDSKPSVSVNVETGDIKDFGNEQYSMPLVDFITRAENVNKNTAITWIKNT